MTQRIISCVLALFSLSSAKAQSTPPLPDLKKELVTAIDARAKFTQVMVDTIFSYAELGFQEFETSRYVTGLLEKSGFRIERGVAGIPTAWVATWSNRGPKPVIALITDIDCIPRASQKPGVAYHDPLIEGAPGHGEGHNTGMAVQVTAALEVQRLMQKYNIAGTLKIVPGVAEELLGTKAHFVRAGLFRDTDIALFAHVASDFSTSYGPAQNSGTGLVSIQYTFRGEAAHAAGAPWRGRSALDAVELMNTGWNFKREHLRNQQRSHYVIVNGGDQPNVVPEEATVWYFFRELDYLHVRDLLELGDSMAKGATMMTGTTVSKRVVGSAWPTHFNKAIAEVQQKNIDAVGMPVWTDADQTLAKALQREISSPVTTGLRAAVSSLRPAPAEESRTGGGSDDIGDISWVVPTVTLRYPSNIPGLPGHHWADAVASATPIAHKGATAGAKAQAMTVLDFLMQPQLVDEAWKYFREVQTKDQKYIPFIADTDKPAIEMNRDKMAPHLEKMRTLYYDSSKAGTYLEQLGIQYPTVRK